jgi:hypothetical protein
VKRNGSTFAAPHLTLALIEVPNGHLKLPISAHKTGQGASPMQVFAENGLMVLSRQINIPWPSVWIGQVVKATSNMANSMKQLAATSFNPSLLLQRPSNHFSESWCCR